ncbi:hypothetical protein BDV29DRAFT_180338 [Aspergillus leporis]|uniref:Uncharacterized protein n=1 Tax=Aspergillus leporis TaxID=41062 RepID=A0A5N5WSQ0_9EURO|nr:hypothetical protein BDV29DRAFT_180338 [Aspergillus leporis]
MAAVSCSGCRAHKSWKATIAHWVIVFFITSTLVVVSIRQLHKTLFKETHKVIVIVWAVNVKGPVLKTNAVQAFPRFKHKQ